MAYPKLFIRCDDCDYYDEWFGDVCCPCCGGQNVFTMDLDDIQCESFDCADLVVDGDVVCRVDDDIPF